MNYKYCLVIAFVILIIGGFLLKLKRVNDLDNRRTSVNDFRNKFIDLANQLMQKGYFDAALYRDCIMNVDKIQIELGALGIASYIKDGLHGIQGNNIPILINYLPELRNYSNELQNCIVRERLLRNIELIDDLLLRHISNLNDAIDSIKTTVLNPFSCFVESIRWLLELPIFILSSFGIISDTVTTKLYGSIFFKVISGLFSLVAFVSGLMTIVLGWDKFIAVIEILIAKIS